MVWYGMVWYSNGMVRYGLLLRFFFCLVYLVFVVSGHPLPPPPTPPLYGDHRTLYGDRRTLYGEDRT